jgi:hypothetical protein
MNAKSFIGRAAIISLWLLVMCGPAAAADEALFVDRYFQLLRTGRSPEVLALLDEPLLSQRRPLLQDNPAYAEFIASRYRNLQVEIVRVQLLDAEHSAVDLNLHLEAGAPPLRTRFILRRYQESWKLLSEKTGG